MTTKNKLDKKVTGINRMTSESLRLGGESDPYRIQSNLNSNNNQGLNRKKIQNSSSSFQITGVSLTRLDFGDDSADDLDESHTDDISRVTDNETPSFSEDSRDTDEPVVEAPTVVSALNTSNCSLLLPPPPPSATITTSTTTTTTTTITSTELPRKQLHTVDPEDEKGPRFKVVKMPNTTPYIKGRWSCFDYFDEIAQNTNQSYFYNDVRIPSSTNINLNFRDEQMEATRDQAQGLINPRFLQESGYNSNLNNESLIAGAHAVTSSITENTTRNVNNIQNSASNNNDKPRNNTKNRFDLNNTVSDIRVALRTSLSASNSNRGTAAPTTHNIDRKIEEALDAVKSHLMVAVHKEVDFLKTRVSTLEGRVNELEIENSILRVNYLLFKS